MEESDAIMLRIQVKKLRDFSDTQIWIHLCSLCEKLWRLFVNKQTPQLLIWCLESHSHYSSCVNRYGGGPTLPRKAINTGFSQSDLAIEVYPLRLQLILMSRGERTFVRISKKVCSHLFTYYWAHCSFF